MRGRGVFIGIDFGTSSSSVAYVFADPRDDGARKVNVETVRFRLDEEEDRTSERMPTLVAAPLDDRRKKQPLVGWDFITRFRQLKRSPELLRHGVSLFRSVKSDLGSLLAYPHSFSADLRTPEHVAAMVLRRLVAETKAALTGYDFSKSHVVVSVPASLGAPAREEVLHAAKLAGMNPSLIQLIDEPVAALIDFINDGRAAGLLEADVPKNILMFDYGGGTLDLSLVRARFDRSSRSGVKVENLAISRYRRLGGDDVDRAIMEEVIWPQIEAHLGTTHLDLPADVRQMIEDTLTPTVARRLKEATCRKIANRDSDSVTRVARRSDAANEAAPSFSIPGLGRKLPSRFGMDEAQFRSIMEPFVTVPDSDDPQHWELECPKSLLVPVLEVLHLAGLRPGDLDAVILHGGSCRNPLVRQMLAEAFVDHETLFGSACVLETPSLDASVARGAAVACYWRHARGEEMVPPIIAEEIGILTLSDKPVMLVPSGSPLPFPDAYGVYAAPTDFFVPRSGVREMRVPVYTGRARRLASVIRVPVPDQCRQGDRVRIKLRVEKDKTLKWWFSVAEGEFCPAEQLYNPWSAAVPTAPERRLQEHRRQIREMVLGAAPLPHWMEFEQAQRLYDADLLDEAEVALQDYFGRYGPIGRAANLMGLICSRHGRQDEALRWFEQAMNLAPGEAVFRGNYGFVLADRGRANEAEAHMRAALNLNSGLRYLYTRLGDLYRERGDETAARREFREALRLVERETGQWPESPVAWRAAEAIYRRVGEYAKAAEAQRRATVLERNERLGGDHTTHIAGPDSGFLPVDDLG